VASTSSGSDVVNGGGALDLEETLSPGSHADGPHWPP